MEVPVPSFVAHELRHGAVASEQGVDARRGLVAVIHGEQTAQLGDHGGDVVELVVEAGEVALAVVGEHGGVTVCRHVGKGDRPNRSDVVR